RRAGPPGASPRCTGARLHFPPPVSAVRAPAAVGSSGGAGLSLIALRRAAWLVGLALVAGCGANLKVGQLAPSVTIGGSDSAIEHDTPDESSGITRDAGACDAGAIEAGLTRPLLDIVILIDNSSSMESRMTALLRRLSTDLTQVMDDGGIDYRVVLITRY